MIFGHVEKTAWLEKITLISKFMTSKTGQQAIAIDILPNILRSKDKQTMKLGRLLEYNKRNIFLQKL